MPTEYTELVAALKALTQGEGTETVTLPMAEDEWNTRPDADSYGTVSLDFEADALNGDNVKQCVAYEGSVDLYSRIRGGDGWIQMIQSTLTAKCEGSWWLNYHGYERDTGLFHWEWAFQVEE